MSNRNPIPVISTFFHNVTEELKKCTWPNRQELIQTAALVILALVIMVILVGAADSAFQAIIDWLISFCAK